MKPPPPKEPKEEKALRLVKPPPAKEANDDGRPMRVVEGVRMPLSATVWGAQRVNTDGTRGEKLAFGELNGIATMEWPVEEFSPKVVLERWGEGDFRISWAYYKANRRCSHGQSTTLRLRHPEKPAAPPQTATPCLQCGVQLPAGLRFCPNCGHSMSAAAPTPIAAPDGMPASFSQGMNLMLEAMRVADGRARADADARIERERLDHQRQMERDRQFHELRVSEMQGQYQRMLAAPAAAPALDAASLAAAIRSAVTESLEEVRGEIEDLNERVTEGAASTAEGSRLVGTFDALAKIGERIAPVVGSLISARLGSNGAAHPAPNAS